ncbi:hypothetical protein BH24ACT4_BH24ACT4_20670 [soil metagenome]
MCRWDGEEFLVLLPDTDQEAASKRAEAFRAGIAETGVTASVGVAEVRPGDTVTAWVARADAAMYAAKQQGRNQVVATPRAKASQDAA